MTGTYRQRYWHMSKVKKPGNNSPAKLIHFYRSSFCRMLFCFRCTVLLLIPHSNAVWMTLLFLRAISTRRSSMVSLSRSSSVKAWAAYSSNLLGVVHHSLILSNWALRAVTTSITRVLSADRPAHAAARSVETHPASGTCTLMVAGRATRNASKKVHAARSTRFFQFIKSILSDRFLSQ